MDELLKNREFFEQELAKRHLLDFLRALWREVEAESFEEALYHAYLCEEVQKVILWACFPKTQPEDAYDLVINVAPGTGKSSIISKFGPVWAWLKNPNLRIIASSYSAPATKSFTTKFQMLMLSDKFRRFFPKMILKEENVQSQTNNYKGVRYATSTNGTITGLHGDLIIVDDHNQPPNIDMDDNGNIRVGKIPLLTDIRSGNSWHDSVLITRKRIPKFSRAIYVQQRVHAVDLSGYLLKKAKKGGINVKHIVLPAFIDKKNKAYEEKYIDGEIVERKELDHLYQEGLLDPIRLPRKVLTKMERGMSTQVFNAQYMQRPTGDVAGLIKPSYFK